MNQGRERGKRAERTTKPGERERFLPERVLLNLAITSVVFLRERHT
jgi:hypothetical protein